MTENAGEQRPAGHSWPEPRAETADPAVNAALAPLRTLAAAPVSGHHSMYSALHDRLLAELNTEPPEER
ncbi:hypothetical protein OL239_13645 [Arthrobacter sp. ATA002]|uniref:hypothetical protein n=1 Tax=Arthrobacter sp. ATA002 TaxID=2991715 RepID=UPI0022A691B0|nr:hypothetical protein [Arthrobacter sp. ATA002]WAP50974.1 hypothetical protein OL239_13645 [Arthrobacter sp. ATA002]